MNYTNNTIKNEINSHELRIMGELKKEYLETKKRIIEEIILELQMEYKLLKKEGPSHSPIFTVSLKVFDLKKLQASGTSIREAEKNAASLALIKLNEAKSS